MGAENILLVPAIVTAKVPYKDAYERSARTLAGRFRENFQQYAGEVDHETVAAGPRG